MKQSWERTQIARDIWKANSHNTRFSFQACVSQSLCQIFPNGWFSVAPCSTPHSETYEKFKSLMNGREFYLPPIYLGCAVS